MTKMVRIDIRVDKDTKQRLIKRADELGITVSDLIRDIILKDKEK